MRLNDHQIQSIRELAAQTAGAGARVWLFGSRLDDTARGGEVDLLLELHDPVDEPALLAARLSARVSCSLGGRRVDVVLAAPNLGRLPIHELAFLKGRLL